MPSLINRLLRTQPNECVFCGTAEILTADHILPKSQGGTSRRDNLQILCKSCNLSKGNKIPPGMRAIPKSIPVIGPKSLISGEMYVDKNGLIWTTPRPQAKQHGTWTAFS